MVYQALQNKLPTKDNLRNHGMYIVSHCSMCMHASESVVHLFLECPFAQSIWQWVFNIFKVILNLHIDLTCFLQHTLK